MVPWEFLFKETPGKSSDALEFRRRRSDSWDPQARHPNFRGGGLGPWSPQGQPPHRHRFLGCKNHRFFFMRESIPKSRRSWKNTINIMVIMWPWREILHQGLWIPWATFCRQRLWRKNWDFENSIKKTRLKDPWKKGAKKSLWRSDTLRSANIAMENPPIVDVFPIGKGGFPACYVSLPEGNKHCS